MNARRKLIAELSEDSLGGIATLQDVDRAEQLVDAYRAEVLAKAVGRLRAIPVDCTALTGPVWYGTGWREAITALEDIADYQTPDDEAYPGELQRLRALAGGLRVAALRKEDLAEAQRLLVIHAEHEIEARGKDHSAAAPDFYQAGHTYTGRHGWRFRCETVLRSHTGEPVAVGWLHFNGVEEIRTYGQGDWETGQQIGWTVTEAGAS